jgi:hypothetical protein
MDSLGSAEHTLGTTGLYCWEMRSHGGIAEDSGCLKCDILFVGVLFPIFQKNLEPLKHRELLTQRHNITPRILKYVCIHQDKIKQRRIWYVTQQ